jgi:hypothetical protein
MAQKIVTGRCGSKAADVPNSNWLCRNCDWVCRVLTMASAAVIDLQNTELRQSCLITRSTARHSAGCFSLRTSRFDPLPPPQCERPLSARSGPPAILPPAAEVILQTGLATAPVACHHYVSWFAEVTASIPRWTEPALSDRAKPASVTRVTACRRLECACVAGPSFRQGETERWECMTEFLVLRWLR